MVLIPRTVASIQVPSDVYTKPHTVLLDTVAGEKMVAVLTQIGQLAEFAADIFNNVLKDATTIGQRISSVGSRIGSIEQLVPNIQYSFANNPPSSFYGGTTPAPSFQRTEKQTDQIFDPQTRPEPITSMRNLAQPPPQVHLLNTFANANCLSKYSDPGFFFQQWYIAEEEKLQKAMQDQQARKAKKKKKQKKQAAPQMKVVEAVQTKVYSAMGKEFEDQAKAAEQQKLQQAQQAMMEQQQQLQGGEDDENDDAAAGNVQQRPQAPQYNYNYGEMQQPQYNAAAPPVPAPPQGDYYQQQYAQPPPVAPQAPGFDGGYNQYAQPPPVVPAAPTAPALNRPQSLYQTPAAPAADWGVPAAPDAPMAPAAPEAPSAPDAPLAPDASSLSDTPAGGGGGGGGGRADLLSAIQSFGKGGLKKVEAQPAAAETSGRSGLLLQIRGGVKLRTVQSEEKKPAAAAGPAAGAGAGAASIRAILARRAAIEQESDDEGEEEWS